MTRAWRGWVTGALALVLLALSARLAHHAVSFAHHGAQMDFAAFWAAGRAAGAGLSPYVNHAERDPALWDGLAVHRHSRFLYPPLVARLLVPLGWMPYARAKVLWTALSLVAVAAALVLALRWTGVRAPPAVLVVACLATGFTPLLALLERGQSDGLLLLLFVAAVGAMGAPRTAWIGGVLLAVATLFKLPLVLVTPFLLLWRQWRAAAGFGVAAAVLLVASFALDGRATLDYAFEQLPRIARHGEGGTRETRLDPRVLAELGRGVPEGSTRIDGRVYRIESLEFVLNASLVRTPLGRAAWSALRGMGLPATPTWVSVLFFAVGATLVLALSPRVVRGQGSPAALLDWQNVLVLVLLTAPVSWAMGVVGLLPYGAIVLALFARGVRASAVIAAGLLIAAVPAPFVAFLGQTQYLVAELLVLVGGLACARVEPGAGR